MRLEAVELQGGRAFVKVPGREEEAARLFMMVGVAQYVEQRSTYFEGSAECALMITFSKERAFDARSTIGGARNTTSQRLHAARE